MRRVLVERIPNRGLKKIILDPTEAHHAASVLRLTTGEEIIAIDGNGGASVCSVILQGKKDVALDWISDLETPKLARHPITLALAVLKSEAMEWVVEKSTELNIASIQPLFTERTIPQFKGDKLLALQARLQRIADQSLKQCESLYKLTIEEPEPLDVWLKKYGGTVYFAHERNHSSQPLLSALTPAQHYALLVGPEGGFSPAESARILSHSNLVPVSLGPLILRAETAALTGVSIIQAHVLDKVRQMEKT